MMMMMMMMRDLKFIVKCAGQKNMMMVFEDMLDLPQDAWLTMGCIPKKQKFGVPMAAAHML